MIQYDLWQIASQHEKESTIFDFKPEMLKEFDLIYNPAFNIIEIRETENKKTFGLVGKLISQLKVLEYLFEENGDTFKDFFGTEYLASFNEGKKIPIMTIGAGLLTSIQPGDSKYVQVGELFSTYFLEKDPKVIYKENLL